MLSTLLAVLLTILVLTALVAFLMIKRRGRLGLRGKAFGMEVELGVDQNAPEPASPDLKKAMDENERLQKDLIEAQQRIINLSETTKTAISTALINVDSDNAEARIEAKRSLRRTRMSLRSTERITRSSARKEHEKRMAFLMSGMEHARRGSDRAAEAQKDEIARLDELRRKMEEETERLQSLEKLNEGAALSLQEHTQKLRDMHEMEQRIHENSSEILNVVNVLDERTKAQSRMLSKLMTGDHKCPTRMLVLPTEISGDSSDFTSIFEWATPSFWVNKKAKLFFICPLTNRPGKTAKGYDIKLQQDWVKSYGPAVLFCLKTINWAARRLGDVDLELFDDTLDALGVDPLETEDNVFEELKTELAEELKREDDEDLRAVAEWADSTEMDEDEADVEHLSKAVEQSHRQVLKLLKDTLNDPEVKDTGLEQVICEHEGSCE